MKTILHYLKPYRMGMLRGFLIKVLGTFADLGLPWVLAYILDHVVPLGHISPVLLWGVGLSCSGGKTSKYQGKSYGIKSGEGCDRGSAA